MSISLSGVVPKVLEQARLAFSDELGDASDARYLHRSLVDWYRSRVENGGKSGALRRIETLAGKIDVNLTDVQEELAIIRQAIEEIPGKQS